MKNENLQIQYSVAIEICNDDYSDTIVIVSLGVYDKLIQVEKLRKKIINSNPGLKFKLLISDVS